MSKINSIILEEVINRCVNAYFRNRLDENSNDRRVNNLIAYYCPGADFNQIRKIRANFLNRIPNARSRGEKWIYRIIQWYFEGDIPNEEIKKLDKFLGWLNSNELDDDVINSGDWRDLPFWRIKQIYDRLFTPKKRRTNSLDDSKIKRVNGFTIRRLDSQAEAQKLGDYFYNGEWCILDNLFDTHVDDCTCYIISNDKTYKKAKPMPVSLMVKKLKNLGYNDTAECIFECDDLYEITEYDCNYFEIANIGNGLPPYDEYGLSAFVVLVGSDGETYGVYSRYNLPNMYDGCIFNEEEIAKIVGVRFEDICPYVEK